MDILIIDDGGEKSKQVIRLISNFLNNYKIDCKEKSENKLDKRSDYFSVEILDYKNNPVRGKYYSDVRPLVGEDIMIEESNFDGKINYVDGKLYKIL
jgi:hypothetical protein